MLEKLRKAVRTNVVPLQGRGQAVALVVFNFFNLVRVSAFLRRSNRDGEDYFIGWPGYKDRNGQWRDSVRPVSNEVTDALLTIAREAYEQAMQIGQRLNPVQEKRPAVMPEEEGEDWPL